MSASSDESSGENSSNDEESETESGSSTSSSDDESGSGSSSSGNVSGSGSSSGEDDDNDSSSDASGSPGGTEEEEEEEEGAEDDEKERRLARKREDFEKMKELSAHMDNVVQRLATYFPPDDTEGEPNTDVVPPSAAPELPPLPLPPPDNARGRYVSARVLTMDRAVSARRMMTDRAISVASGLHFDDELSASTASNSRHGEDEQRAKRRGSGGRGQRGTSRRQSRADSNRRGMDTDEPVGSRKHEAEGPDTAEHRKRTTSNWSRKDTSASVVGKGLGLKLESSGGGRRSRSPPGRAGANLGFEDSHGANLGFEDSHERLLWDELRESLEGVAGSDAVPPAWGHGAAAEKARAERAREEQRRRLIDEAIAVLLEGSSSSSDSSSEDERIDNDDD
ncbi:unnamed protein product [Ectocarpus sp. CCAP 1310/34]|nr:unnamed protein product [Ectocarpus sp. CCAP 1310/34]